MIQKGRETGEQGKGVSISARFVAGKASWQVWLVWGVHAGESIECLVKFRQWRLMWGFGVGIRPVSGSALARLITRLICREPETGRSGVRES